MILQELYKLYDRLVDDPKTQKNIPIFAHEQLGITYVITLKKDGEFNIHLLMDKQSKKKDKIVPSVGKRTSKIKPRFLCDNQKYIWGVDSNKNATPKNMEEFHLKHIQAQKEINSPQYDIFCSFLEKKRNYSILNHPDWKNISSGNAIFRIEGESQYLHEIAAIKKYWEKHEQDWNPDKQNRKGFCLITNEYSQLARIHPAIKGLNAEKDVLSIIAFQEAKTAFESYGNKKAQAFNSPVSKLAAFKYVTALNYLAKSDGQHIQLIKNKKQDTIFFWTEKPTPVEDILGDMLNPPKEDSLSEQDLPRLKKVKNFLEGLLKAGSPALGEFAHEAGTQFFMLGLSPNVSRVSIRFWYEGTLGDFAEKLRQHYLALQIIGRPDKDPEFIPIWQILLQTAGESKKISPLLGGALMRSILHGTFYPTGLIQLIINRIKADSNINYVRAAVIKAFLTRNKKQILTMSLDTTNTIPAYRLGRLFAVLEKAQEEAIPNVNSEKKESFSGIRKSFYSSASATPAGVFPIIMRNYPHHVAKLEKGRGIFFDKLV